MIAELSSQSTAPYQGPQCIHPCRQAACAAFLRFPRPEQVYPFGCGPRRTFPVRLRRPQRRRLRGGVETYLSLVRSAPIGRGFRAGGMESPFWAHFTRLTRRADKTDHFCQMQQRVFSELGRLLSMVRSQMNPSQSQSLLVISGDSRAT